ncbi:MAG: hypothetical protein RL129_1249 [Actinomycetota bacterium]|jgi:hypothetical protein
MGIFKKGWWKITPKGVGNASGAFGVFDEIFHPQAHEATQIKEEQRGQFSKLEMKVIP